MLSLRDEEKCLKVLFIRVLFNSIASSLLFLKVASFWGSGRWVITGIPCWILALTGTYLDSHGHSLLMQTEVPSLMVEILQSRPLGKSILP